MSFNPWLVESLQDFSYFCCPECVYRSQGEYEFQAHAIQNHPQAQEFFKSAEKIKEEDDDDDQEEAPFDDMKPEAFDSNDDDDAEEEEDVPSEGKKLDYRCFFCPESFKRKYLLKSHQEEAHTDGFGRLPDVKCDQCDKFFATQQMLKAHKSRVHSKNTKCPECSEMFAKNEIKQHLYNAHPDKDFLYHKCDLCDFATYSKECLKAHVSYKHQAKKYICEKCSMAFRFPYFLKQHDCDGTLSPTVATKCDLCDTKFLSREEATEHYKNVHDQELPEYFSMKRRGARKNDPQACPECNEMFSGLVYLHQHYTTTHGGVLPSMQGRLSFMCEFCPKVYFNKSRLKVHQRTAHLGFPRRKRSYTSKQKCPHCDKVLSRNAFNEHVKSKHELNTPYKCDMCAASFGTRGRLLLHKKDVHERVKCDICEKEISSIFNLRKHKANVHGVVPEKSKCPHCPQVFVCKIACDKHIDKHHPETKL